MPGPLGEGQCYTPQIKMTLHGAGAVQGVFGTTVQMGFLFPSPKVSSYALQSSGNLQAVQGAQAMGAKNQHQPLSAPDTMIYQCLIKTIASPMLGAIPSPFLNPSRYQRPLTCLAVALPRGLLQHWPCVLPRLCCSRAGEPPARGGPSSPGSPGHMAKAAAPGSAEQGSFAKQLQCQSKKPPWVKVQPAGAAS